MHRNKFLFNKTNRSTNFPNLFLLRNLHVAGSSSAHHQEFFTVHSALVYVIKLARHVPVPNVQWKTPDDGQRNCPKHVEFLNKNKFGKLVLLLVLLKRNENLIFAILEAVTLAIDEGTSFFWITSFRLLKTYRIITEADCLHLQGLYSLYWDGSDPECTETSVSIYRSKWFHIQEDLKLRFYGFCLFVS